MEAGIALSRWFGSEARRVYRVLGESEEEGEARRLLELIDRKGGKVTPRDLQRGSSKYGSAKEAEEVLGRLVTGGMGTWEEVPPGPKGGRPTRVFIRTAPVKPTEPSEKPAEVVSAPTDRTRLNSDETQGEPSQGVADGPLAREADLSVSSDAEVSGSVEPNNPTASPPGVVSMDIDTTPSGTDRTQNGTSQGGAGGPRKASRVSSVLSVVSNAENSISVPAEPAGPATSLPGVVSASIDTTPSMGDETQSLVSQGGKEGPAARKDDPSVSSVVSEGGEEVAKWTA